jgi:chromatin remodeling complex protein RSC6
MTEESNIPANVKKMISAIEQMDYKFKQQKTEINQMEKQFQTLKKLVLSFIENNKKTVKKTKKPSGFMLPVPISPELCKFLNIEEGSNAARTEVTRFLIQYIEERHLTHPEKKTLVIPDEELALLLGPDVDLDTLTRFTIQKYMNRHYSKISS